MLVKLTPWVNFFINILRAAFTRADPEWAKKTENLTVFFVLSGSAHIKAAGRMLVKLTPDVIDVADHQLYREDAILW